MGKSPATTTDTTRFTILPSWSSWSWLAYSVFQDTTFKNQLEAHDIAFCTLFWLRQILEVGLKDWENVVESSGLDGEKLDSTI